MFGQSINNPDNSDNNLVSLLSPTVATKCLQIYSLAGSLLLLLLLGLLPSPLLFHSLPGPVLVGNGPELLLLVWQGVEAEGGAEELALVDSKTLFYVKAERPLIFQLDAEISYPPLQVRVSSGVQLVSMPLPENFSTQALGLFFKADSVLGHEQLREVLDAALLFGEHLRLLLQLCDGSVELL